MKKKRVTIEIYQVVPTKKYPEPQVGFYYTIINAKGKPIEGGYGLDANGNSTMKAAIEAGLSHANGYLDPSYYTQ